MTTFWIFGETVSHTRVLRYSEVLVLSPELETQKVEKTNSVAALPRVWDRNLKVLFWLALLMILRADETAIRRLPFIP